MKIIKCKSCKKKLPNKDFLTSDGCRWCDTNRLTLKLMDDILNHNDKKGDNNDKNNEKEI